MDEVKDWLINLSIGDAYPVRDYGYKETARLANKCLALLKEKYCEMDESKIIEAFDEAKQEVWTDDDQYTVGYNNGLEAGKNIAIDLLKGRFAKL